MKADPGVCIKFMKLKLLSNVLKHFVIGNQSDKELIENVNRILMAFIECP